MLCRLITASLFCAALAATSCSPGQPEQAAQNEADRIAIAGLFDRVLAAASAGDLEGLMACFTDDAIWMFGDRWTDVDKAGATEAYRGFLDWARPAPDNYTISIDEIGVAGGWAYVRSTHRGQVVKRDGGAVEQGSRHLSILQRQADGTWRIARDVFVNPPLGEE
jgi:uncharacterized protein (TIGR02246 family)